MNTNWFTLNVYPRPSQPYTVGDIWDYGKAVDDYRVHILDKFGLSLGVDKLPPLKSVHALLKGECNVNYFSPATAGMVGYGWYTTRLSEGGVITVMVDPILVLFKHRRLYKFFQGMGN